MTREIKFHAWDLDRKVMITSPSRLSITYIEGEFTVFDQKQNGDRINCELLQYTGLKDKNDKEIYEGDVLKTTCTEDWQKDEGHETLQVVSWDENQYKFGLNLSCDLSWGGYESFEVIGNIYQNPELLT